MAKFLEKVVDCPADQKATSAKEMNTLAKDAGVKDPVQAFKSVGIEGKTFTVKRSMGGGKDYRAYARKGMSLSLRT